jgi:VanZ like protein
VTALGALAIASQTLIPHPATIGAAPSPQVGFAADDLAGIDILFNILLFIPFGIGLRLSGGSRRRCVAIAASLSGAVELLQLGVVAGRESSVRDVVTNTLGALLGVWLADGWRRLAFPAENERHRLRALAAALWLLVIAGEAAQLTRAFPTTIWFGQWAPGGVFPATFGGRVLAVRLDSLELPGGRLANADRVRASLLADRWTLHVTATTGAPTADVSSVFSLFDDRQQEMLLVGQLGTDLIVRFRTRAADFGLRSPSVLLPGAFALPAGEPIEISMAFDRGRITLATTSSAGAVSRRVSVTPSWGWNLVLPFHVPIGRRAHLWSALWIVFLIFPSGYWAGRSITALALGGLLLCVGTALPTLLFGFPPAALREWLAGATGLVMGWWLGRTGR